MYTKCKDLYQLLTNAATTILKYVYKYGFYSSSLVICFLVYQAMFVIVTTLNLKYVQHYDSFIRRPLGRPPFCNTQIGDIYQA